MSVVLGTSVRNASANAATALLGGAVLKFLDAGSNVVAEIAIPAGGFAPAVAGVATLLAPLVDPFTGSGTITTFRIESLASALLVSGSVSVVGGGGDIELSSVTYTAGDTLTLPIVTYTQPES
jgi:hypothetical protein